MPSDQTQSEANPKELSFKLYDFAIGEDDARFCRDIPDEQCREQPRSFIWQIIAQALSKTGDVLADPKVVLPWLLGAVGAPTFLVGFLVPIRESLALIPQIIVGAVIRKFPVRKWFWIAGSLVEGSCIVLMGLIATIGLRGAAAGWAIIGLLIAFSIARGVASIAAKDTLGKTISKGRRGRVSGYAATVSGLIAGTVGLYLALGPTASKPDWLLYALIISAGICWFVATVAFAMINEHPGATDGGSGLLDVIHEQIELLRSDRELQKFLLARTLMISTALVGPVYVSLAQRETGMELDGLGWLMIASGFASALSATIWGALSDKSSRRTMALAAAMVGFLGVFVIAARNLLPTATEGISFYAIVLFVLGIAHAGVRIGRKTHIVDIAGGDQKAVYVALSNTIIGLLLLVIGGLTGLLLSIGMEFGIAVLSGLALIGAAMALTLKNAQD